MEFGIRGVAEVNELWRVPDYVCNNEQVDKMYSVAKHQIICHTLHVSMFQLANSAVQLKGSIPIDGRD